MTLRLSALVLGAFVLSATAWGQAGLTIERQPVHVVHRTFDPQHPPSAMPKLVPPEVAVTDGEFLSNATVGGQARQVAADRAELKITSVDIKLNLNITVWLPKGASAAVSDHEEGHRQISEYYYKNADAVVRQIGKAYLGKVVSVTGPNLHKAVDDELSKISAEITQEYNKRMPVEPTQARYDKITGHSLIDIPVADAIAQALKETYPKS